MNKYDAVRRLYESSILREQDKEYKAFFQKTLEKYGAKSPTELSDEDKKKFYDEIDKGWKAKKETD